MLKIKERLERKEPSLKERYGQARETRVMQESENKPFCFICASITRAAPTKRDL